MHSARRNYDLIQRLLLLLNIIKPKLLFWSNKVQETVLLLTLSTMHPKIRAFSPRAFFLEIFVGEVIPGEDVRALFHTGFSGGR